MAAGAIWTGCSTSSPPTPKRRANGYYFDAVVYHLYFNPSQAPQVLAEAQASLKKHGIAGKEIWINETNAPPSNDPQEPPWSKPRFKITVDEQAAFVIQEFSLAFAAGAAAASSSTSCATAPTTPNPSSPTACCARDDSPRPAFDAYRVATTYLARLPLGVLAETGTGQRGHVRPGR